MTDDCEFSPELLKDVAQVAEETAIRGNDVVIEWYDKYLADRTYVPKHWQTFFDALMIELREKGRDLDRNELVELFCPKVEEVKAPPIMTPKDDEAFRLYSDEHGQ